MITFELLSTIALMCQISVGAGGGSAHHTTYSTTKAALCQTYLAQCTAPEHTASKLLKCNEKRLECLGSRVVNIDARCK